MKQRDIQQSVISQPTHIYCQNVIHVIKSPDPS